MQPYAWNPWNNMLDNILDYSVSVFLDTSQALEDALQAILCIESLQYYVAHFTVSEHSTRKASRTLEDALR